jgi:hypothetical protein
MWETLIARIKASMSFPKRSTADQPMFVPASWGGVLAGRDRVAAAPSRTPNLKVSAFYRVGGLFRDP